MGGTMRSVVVLAALMVLGAVDARAQQTAPAEGLRLSPATTMQLQQEAERSKLRTTFRRDEIRDLGGGHGEGVSYHESDVFVGTFKRSTSPYNSKIRPWVLDEGIYAKRSGERFVGRFHFFHEDWGDHDSAMENQSRPMDGVYFLVGSRFTKSGAAQPGIYRSDVNNHVYNFVRADEGYLAWFEKRYQSQVNAFRQARTATRNSGLSFGQVLALGLGAAVIGSADIPSTDAVEIGGALVTDILSKGQSNALGGVVESRSRQSSTSQTGSPTSSTAAAGGSGGYTKETVTLSCPSGVSNSVPLQYRTRACRNAMIVYWKAYACNQLGNIARATQQCKSACGNAQCRE